MSAAIEIPPDIVERVDTRSAAHAFDIRRRPFCLLVAVADPAGWTEIRELVTDSYRLLAPKRIAAQLD